MNDKLPLGDVSTRRVHVAAALLGLWLAAGCGGGKKAPAHAGGGHETSSSTGGGSANAGGGEGSGGDSTDKAEGEGDGKPKKSACAGGDVELMAALIQSACEVPNSKAGDKPADVKTALDVKVSPSASKVAPG